MSNINAFPSEKNTPKFVLSKNFKFVLSISFILVLALACIAQAEDVTPPDFAGAANSGRVFWEFNADSDQPTDYDYTSGTKNGNTDFGFRYNEGCWTWQSGGYMNMNYCEDSLVQPIPAGTGANCTVYFQVTWQGDDYDPPLNLGAELWADYANSHLAGIEGLAPIDDYTVGAWRQTTWQYTFMEFDKAATHFHIIFNLDNVVNVTIDEVVVDMVVHDGESPVELTVGNTEILSSTTSINNRRAVPFSMPENGTIRSITMWHGEGSAGDMLFGLYDDDSGKPGSRLAFTEETPTTSSAGWQTINLTIPILVESQAKIWLAFLYQDALDVKYGTIASEWGQAVTDPSKNWTNIPRMPELFGGSDTSIDQTYSIYATYTPGGSPPDQNAPQPNPSTWELEPNAMSATAISMTATEATDDSVVQYYFDCNETISGPGGDDSDWQYENTYIDSGLSPETQYTYRVKTRDMSPYNNETDFSNPCSATTLAPVTDCPEADFNGDCVVDEYDLYIFTDQWLDGPGCIGVPTDECADLDGQDDGIDFQDYAYLAMNWKIEGTQLRINEFMASNDSTISDPQGEYDDWLEIYNASGVTIDLAGWFLEDKGNRWQFPTDRPTDTTLLPYNYMIIWADDDSLETSGLHTNFKLSAGGDEIALYSTDGTTLFDFIAFQDQVTDVSYGRYPDASNDWFYMALTTPGNANQIGMAGAVYFSKPGGTFTSSFDLALTTKSATADIYYTTNGNEPTTSDTQYTAPFSVTETTWLRARAYESGQTAGRITSRTYIKLDSDVTTFQSNLPIVIIESFGKNIDTANRDFHPVISAFIDTDETTGRAAITDPADYSGCGGMHIRGNSTEDYPKRQFRFETWDENRPDPDPVHARYLDKAVSLLGLPAESDWIIHGPWSDRTQMRNYQMYTWSNLIGRYASRTVFVEVFLDYDGNGKIEWDTGLDSSTTDYRGVYVLMEKIKRDKNRVDIERLEPIHNSEPEITGGYLLKKDWDDHFETSIYHDLLLYWDPEYGELTSTQKNWIQNYIDDFEAVLSGPSFDDPVTGYVQYIDVLSFIDHHILVELAKNVDGFVLSTYLSKDRGGKINMGPIWDYNGSLGGADYVCDYDPEGWLHTANTAEDCPDDCMGEGGIWPLDLPEHYFWYERLFEDSEFLLQYADRWFELREALFSTASMTQDLTDNLNLLTDNGAPDNPVDRNYARWDNLEDEIWPNYYDNCWASGATYMDYYNWLYAWVVARLTWMDSEIDAEYGGFPPEIKVNGSLQNTGGYITDTDDVTLTDVTGTIYYTTDGSDPRLHGGAVSGSAYTYSSALNFSKSTQIKTRAEDSEKWTALNEATFAVGPVADNLRITEIMYHPEETGNPDDPNTEFIELKNIGPETINLNLVKFTNGIDFTFGDISLGNGDYVVVAKDIAVFNAKYQTFSGNLTGPYPGRLNNAGEKIELQDAAGQIIHDFSFKDGWFHITDGNDFSLNIINPSSSDPNDWEYSTGWRPSTHARGTPGQDDTAQVAQPGDIVINEILSHSNGNPYNYDWIELHNTTSSSIDISGWFLSEDNDDFAKYQIPASTSISANGYKCFRQDTDFGSAFGLSELGETVYLSSGSGGALDGGFCVKEDFKAADADVTFGRFTKSTSDVDFTAMSLPTYEVENTAPPKVGPVVITEIMYHPAGNNYAEYIEIYNTSGSPVNLYDPAHPENTWKFTDEDGGIEFYFPQYTTLAGHETILLVKNEYAVTQEFGSPGVSTFEWLEGRLSNAGEKINLWMPGEPEPDGFVPYIRVDRINYSDGSHPENFRENGFVDPWPTSPDGSGNSLNRDTLTDYGNEPTNWNDASPTPGS